MAKVRGGTRIAGQGGNWIRAPKRYAIYCRDGVACVYCGASLADGAVMTLDHLLPCSLGGSNSERNLVTACRPCNSARQDMALRDWLIVLADRGVDTTGLAAKIRSHTRRSLTPYMAAARQLLRDAR